MTKKSGAVLTLLLALLLIVTTACSGGTGEIKEPSHVGGGAVSSGGDNQTPDAGEITIAETVLYEGEGIKVTALGYADDWFGPEVQLLVENDSERDVLVTAESVSANGYMMPFASLYAEVAAGKKANESLIFSQSELDQSGVEIISRMQFYVSVSDPESWKTIATSELITLTTSADGLEQPVDDSGDVVYEDNGIRVVCKGLMQDMIWDGTVVFFMENNSGRNITVYAENVSVNGFMQEVSLWSDLRDGTMLVDGMTLLELDDLALESVDQVETIEFSLRIIDGETWDDIDSTEPIVLNF